MIKFLVIVIVWKPTFTGSLEVYFSGKYLNSIDGGNNNFDIQSEW